MRFISRDMAAKEFLISLREQVIFVDCGCHPWVGIGVPVRIPNLWDRDRLFKILAFMYSQQKIDFSIMFPFNFKFAH